MDEVRIPPSGDPFTAYAHPDDQDEHPHGCLNGYVYVGHMVEGEDGQEVEEFVPYPCRRCAREGG